MKSLIQAGLFCCLLVVRLCVCLGQGNEDAFKSSIQDLIRKIHEQDEKIAAIEENAKLDRKDLFSKILMLEEKLKDSDYKQGKLEKTIENMDNIIKELELKTWIKNEESLQNEHFSEKKKQENSSVEPAAVNAFHNMTSSGQDRSFAVETKLKRIINGGVYTSKLSTIFIY